MQAPALWSLLIILMIALLIGGYLQIESIDANDLFLNMDALILRLRELGIVGPLIAAQGTKRQLPG